MTARVYGIAVTGEEQENFDSQSIKTWMIAKEFNLLPDTYNKLTENGFTTIDQFKLMQPSEIIEAAKEMGIKLVDRFALKRASDIFGNKKHFIDPGELSIINSINLKITAFEAQVNYVNAKEKRVNNEKKRIEHKINTIFKTLAKTLDNRKHNLLQKLNNIIEKNIEQIKERQNDMKQSLSAMKKYKNDAKNLMNVTISMNELKDRKLRIEQNETEIVKIMKQSNKKHSFVIDDKIYFALDTNKAVQFLSGLGSISNINTPTLQSLAVYDNIIKVGWKIDTTEYSFVKDEKIRIEYSLVNDEKKDNWISKDFEIDSKINGRIDNIKVEKIGVYMVRIKHIGSNICSGNSNTKFVTITSVLPVLRWNTAKNCHHPKVEFVNCNTVKCHWVIATVDYVIKAKDVEVFCFEFEIIDYDSNSEKFDACFGFAPHPLSKDITNFGTGLYHQSYGIYCIYCRKTVHSCHRDKVKTTIKLPNGAKFKRNDKFGFRVNMKKKTAECFYNGINLGIVFRNFPDAIIPAASGNGYAAFSTLKVKSIRY